MSLSETGSGSVFRQGPNRLVFDPIAALRDIYHNDSETFLNKMIFVLHCYSTKLNIQLLKETSDLLSASRLGLT